MLRIGYIGNFGDFHTEIGVADALEESEQIDRYQINQLNAIKFLERKYDVLLTTHPFNLKEDFLTKFQGISIAHYFDLIINWKGRQNVYFPSLKHFDLVLSTDGTDSSVYEKSGINRKYFRQAYNPDWYYPIESKKVRDVSFIGHNYGDRKTLINLLNKKYDFKQFGQDNLCRGKEHSKVCASSKIMVAENATNSVAGYWSNRVYLHLACKAFVLHPYIKDMEKYFEDKRHLVYWKDLTDLQDKIDYYLNHEEEREEIATAGHELVLSRDTWSKRMEEFWHILSRLG